MECALLNRYGLLAVTGPDARAFLHAQLTNDIENLPADRAALAGWCTAKGRLLATMLVIPSADGFLLQLARDIAPMVAKRLSMFVLRSKVKIADESANLAQVGVWTSEWKGPDVAWQEGTRAVRVRVEAGRFLLIGPGLSEPCSKGEEAWSLAEIRAGRPFISAATQDKFVPQMVNLESLGGINFQKGCYPGQEIVARSQYRGEVKRRRKQFAAPAGAPLQPGAEFNGGMVVDAAGGELLAVVPV
jgi:folate-binding protein YgfZ